MARASADLDSKDTTIAALLEQLRAVTAELATAELCLLAVGTLISPDDARCFLPVGQLVGDDGRLDPGKARAALADLVARKPYLGVAPWPRYGQTMTNAPTAARVARAGPGRVAAFAGPAPAAVDVGGALPGRTPAPDERAGGR